MDWSPILIELPQQIVGPRIVLRPYETDDVPRFMESVAESQEHLGPWMPWADQYHGPDDAFAFIVRTQARWLLRDDLALGIFDRVTGRHLGGTGLHRIDWQIRRFEIGYWIRKSAEGQGYVSESTKLLTRLAFDTLGANRVEIRMDTRNDRSRRVPERLGFVLEGILRRAHTPQQGETTPHDTHLFALIREDYAALPWSTGEA